MKRIIKWVDSYFTIVFLLVLGVVLLFNDLKLLSDEKTKNLIDHSGTFSRHSFTTDPGGFRDPGSHRYYFWLEENYCTYQIKADFFKYFDKKAFLSNVERGEILRVKILKKDFEKVYSQNEKIHVYAISINGKDLLNENLTTDKHWSGSVYGLLFIIAGIIVLFRMRRNE